MARNFKLMIAIGDCLENPHHTIAAVLEATIYTGMATIALLCTRLPAFVLLVLRIGWVT
jgi:hypothetical protein